MSRTCRASYLVLGLAVLAGLGRVATQANQRLADNPQPGPATASSATQPPQVTAFVITCKGMIDDGLYRSIRRRTQLAIEQGADYVVYEIGTYGGLVQAADDISKYLILEAGKNLHTVAYVVTEAISAGAMVSVSCKDIVMRHSTTIGDCAPITLGGKLEGVEREKAESFIRAAFMRAAEANNYPPALLKAMVSLRMKVYRVKNLQTNQDEFFEEEELPADPNKYDLTDKQLVVSSDEILTLTAAQAYEYHIARALVDDLDGVFTFLGGRDGVAFAEKIPRLQPNWSEQMVRWLNSPVVFGILFMIALLGVYVEFNTPGVGLPGLVAVICFAIIFGSKYLVGMADWIEIALFAVGALLLAVEIFVLPGFGVAGVLGIMFMLAGLLGILVPQNIPWPRSDFDWKLFTNGAIALSSGFVAFLLLAYVLSRFIPRLEFFSGLILAPAEAKQGTEFEVSYTAPAQNGQVQLKVGDIGEVLTPLRPAGTARFASAVVDVVAEAAFLEGGTRVIIMAIHGNKVVVRKMESR